MIKYAMGRLGQALLVLAAAYTLTFLLLFVIPQDAIDAQFDPNLGDPGAAEQKERLRAYYGLDQPIVVQFVTQAIRLVQGDLGRSLSTGAPVGASIGQALAPTITLALSALVLATVIAFAVAVAATATHRAWLRTLLRSLPAAAVAIPAFIVGLVLLQVFSYQLRWLPSIGDHGIATLVLPTLALAIPVSAPIAQLLVATLSAEMDKPYARTAAAKGFTRLAVVMREALRNASLPALTITGITLGNLLSGAIIIETVYSRAGIGRLTETAVRNQDVPVVQGVVMFAAVVFVAVNFVVDTAYPLLDPRLRSEIVRARRDPQAVTA